MKNSPKIVVFFLALMSTIIIHWINHDYLSEANPNLLRKGISVASQDDASYLSPVENACAGKGWRSNAIGNAAYLTRTPGYGFIYAAFRIWLPQKAALLGLLSLQFFLFAFGASLVYSIVRLLNLDVLWALFIAIAYAMMPMFSGFLSYTLTEGVTPSLVIIFMYLVLRSASGEQNGFWLSAVVLAFLIIIRPAMAILIFVYPLQLLFYGWKSNWRNIVSAITIAFFPMILWQIYGLAKTNELPGMHAIYHNDANDLYRPVHQKLWDFHKSWGQEGSEFHNDVSGIWQAALNEVPARDAIDNLIGHLPKAVIETVGQEQIQWTYQTYYQVLKAQKPFFKSGKPMLGQTELELALGDSIQKFTKTYRSEHWFNTWLVVPVKVYWNMAAHSNLSLYVFQKPWRGILFVEALRCMSFLVHLSVFVLFPIFLFLNFRSKTAMMLGLPIALYLIYLCFVQRGVEERYTLPFLLPMLIFVKVFASDIINRYRLKNGKSD